MSTKKKLQAAFAAAHKRTVRIDDELRIWMGSAEELRVMAPDIRRVIDKALAAGKSVTEDGITQWIEERDEFDPTKEGSARWTWHADGDRVRMLRTLVTKGPEGEPTRQALKPVWRRWDTV